MSTVKAIILLYEVCACVCFCHKWQEQQNENSEHFYVIWMDSMLNIGGNVFDRDFDWIA